MRRFFVPVPAMVIPAISGLPGPTKFSAERLVRRVVLPVPAS